MKPNHLIFILIESTLRNCGQTTHAAGQRTDKIRLTDRPGGGMKEDKKTQQSYLISTKEARERERVVHTAHSSL